MLLLAGTAVAEDSEEAALALADKTQTEAKPPSDWRLAAEGALIESVPRAGGEPTHAQRVSFDALYDHRFAPAWRFVFADRLDVAWRGAPAYEDSINTLKETYVSWQPEADRLFDLGRLNLRYGVATGYNPTDFLRTGAVRSVVSVLPASLRENRLGTVMLRGQQLWNSGSLSALYAPKLADPSNSSPFSPDFGATNNQNRWLLALSQKLGDDFNPQWLLYDDAGGSPQLGVNLTALLNDATIAYLEWSGGRSRSLLSQALAASDDTSFRSRAAGGLTYTAATKVTVTLEYDYNGAGLDEDDWNRLRTGPPAAYVQYRNFVERLQDPPTQRNVFFFARWEDALLVHLDLSALARLNLADDSRLSFLEARYHWEHVDAALQWQHNGGAATSEFGALLQETIWQALVTYFF
ncbi:MAG: hypothetical protein ACJ8NR_06340 [Sulfurifustis sp.]